MEGVLARYKRAWESGKRPNFRQELKKLKMRPDFAEAAVELAIIQLDRCLLAGDDTPLVEYLRDDLISEGLQPEQVGRAVALLAEVECRCRWRRGEPGVRRTDYVARFPALAEAVEDWI